jgi:iron(III) transport system substrate-binding protein
MKQVNGSLVHSFVLAAIIGLACRADAAQVDALIAAAKKEGSLDFRAPSSLGPQAIEALGAAFNKKYGLSINLNYLPSKGYTQDLTRVISQAAIGVAPDADVMALNINLHAVLAQKKLHLPFDYNSLGVDPRAINHEGGSISVEHAIILPLYNTKLVATKDVPRSWDDLLDPKWRNGKLGVADSTHYFTLLAAGPWGETKTMDYVKSLAKQRPFLGRQSEIYTRLQLGEVLVSGPMFEAFSYRAKTSGAPIAFAENVEPVLVSTTNIAVLKGAAHPNAARLFLAFMVTPEVQQLWEKFSGMTSALIPGTKTYNFLQGKQVAFMGQDPEAVERLSNEYSKLLGFIR